MLELLQAHLDAIAVVTALIGIGWYANNRLRDVDTSIAVLSSKLEHMERDLQEVKESSARELKEFKESAQRNFEKLFDLVRNGKD